MADKPGDKDESALVSLLRSPSAEAIREYLILMENTEPPRTYLIWSLISAAASLLGKNSKFTSGPLYTVKPNLFIVLLGPAGVRKSSAISLISKMLENTTINFGPTDSGGQRHGLMSALTGLNRPDWMAGHRGKRQPDTGALTFLMSQPRLASDMTIHVAELGRLLGVGSREMADFMVDLWDGAKIDYETKAGSTEINSPLVNLLGACTPSSLASMIPDNAGTHGILSRIVFIYEEKKYKEVPLPPTPDELWWDRRERFVQRLHWIDSNRQDFSLDHDATSFYNGIYAYIPELRDSRLEHYRERRANILLRVGMAVCALRFDTQIVESDLLLAHEFLKLAEPKFHKALEYFGRNKIYSGRMLMLQFLRNSPTHFATHAELVAAAGSELKASEADEAIQNMITSGEIIAWGADGRYTLGELKNDLTEAKAKRGPRSQKPTGT